MRKVIWSAALAAMALCAPTYGQGQPQKASYRPATEAEIAAIREAMMTRLADAESARFRDVVIFTVNPEDPVVCGLVNAKNKMGAYVGFSRFIGMVFQRPAGQAPKAVIVGIDSPGESAADAACLLRMAG